MPRYIDADALKRRIYASPMFFHFGEDGFFIRDGVLNLIEKFTADVAPKSEVDKDIKVLTKEVAKRKAMLLDAIDTFRNLLCIESWLDYEDTRKYYVVSIDDVNRIHAELKKKYTEEK